LARGRSGCGTGKEFSIPYKNCLGGLNNEPWNAVVVKDEKEATGGTILGGFLLNRQVRRKNLVTLLVTQWRFSFKNK
jgi:hypothetical protein